MKKILVILLILMSLGLNSIEKLTIYSYDSFSWIKKDLIKKFEENEDCEINLVTFENTGKSLARLKLENKNPKADLIIGLTPTSTEKAKNENLLAKYDFSIDKKISKKEYKFDKENYVMPYDFGGLAVIFNPEEMKEIPKSFEDITKLDKKLIIQDPRTSSTGQDFLLWTIALYGDQWQDFWKKLKPAILTVSPGWSAAFKKFEVGEAPMMVSYATDGAYSFHNYKSTKYKALIPKEGGYLQKEGAAIVKGTKNKELAQKFMNFMLSKDFQKNIPLNQWMFPVVDVEMPEAFKYAKTPKKIVDLDGDEINKNIDKWINDWEKIMQ